MFKIYMGDIDVGCAEVKRVGLYYHITCKCKPPSNQIHRIIIRNERFIKDLGICFPEGNEFRLFARIPVKCFQGDTFTFELVNSAKCEVVVSDNMPFAYLDKLETARLQLTNEQSIIVIDSVPSPQDSDQNQEYPNR